MVGHKGTYAYHLGAQLLKEAQVRDNVVCGLVRSAHHEACTYLIAQLAELKETFLAVSKAHLRRVEL